MKLSEFKSHLSDIPKLNFLLPNGNPIPYHFHITEAGLVTKHFIDCGKTIHLKKTAVFQVWTANDVWHRLKPETLIDIISKSDKVFHGEDPEVEIEYQMDTIGKFGLDFRDGRFILTVKKTECLANDRCIIPSETYCKSKSAEKAKIKNYSEPTIGCC